MQTHARIDYIAIQDITYGCIEVWLSGTAGWQDMREQETIPRDAQDTAVYIQRMDKELRALAIEADLGFLAYLLAMVEDDAAATAGRAAER